MSTLNTQQSLPSLASQPFAARLQRALHHLRLGRPVILMDDFDRENEADLIVAADTLVLTVNNRLARRLTLELAGLLRQERQLDPPVLTVAPANEVPVTSNGQLGSISLDQPLREARDEFERIYFEYHLVRESHSMTRVSERTGLERTHLYRKLKQLGIESARKRST
ncbi:hypothetical protein G6F63_014554 [Rhizopus arrhizus]|nr:hypothetical protein G6F63_014554 [Rhizopus arrhizus]